MRGSARLGVDIGGTFTDFVLLLPDGRAVCLKVASTPARPEEAVIAGIRRLLAQSNLAPSDLGEILHGTTVGSNTLLQKTGARAGLITTRGFRDVLEIGRVRTPGMFDLQWDKPAPLIPRRLRAEVGERMSAAGEVLRPAVPAEVAAAGCALAAAGAEVLAVCFLNSHVNPANERAAVAALDAALPGMPVVASVDVLPESGEYERTSTTAVNAYVLPVLRGYVERLETALRSIGIGAPLFIASSAGDLATAETARGKPVFFISSGRSAGAVGGASLAAAVGEPNLVVFDMGGTTASAALVNEGALTRTNEYEFRAGMSMPSRFIKAGGYMMRVPTVDVAEVGSGAGSIAAIDAGGLLTVGPLSAGSRPGPVCYRAGGEQPTVTDANVVLGFLPEALAGDDLRLDREAAREAIGRVLGRPLGIGVEEAACGVREVVNVNMARAIRAVTVERGLDPRDFTLLAIGGSGPVHACDLARTLGIGRVLFPPAPGVFTAMGMLASTVAHHLLAPLPGDLDALDPERLRILAAGLGEAGLAALRRDGYGPEAARLAFTLDLRFRGQEATLPVAFAVPVTHEALAELRPAFLESYRRTFDYVSSDRIETAALRLAAYGVSRNLLDFGALRLVAGPAPVGDRERPVHFDRRSGWVRTPVVDRSGFAGRTVGPLILESPDTAIVVPPGVAVEADATGNLLATLT